MNKKCGIATAKGCAWILWVLLINGKLWSHKLLYEAYICSDLIVKALSASQLLFVTTMICKEMHWLDPKRIKSEGTIFHSINEFCDLCLVHTNIGYWTWLKLKSALHKLCFGQKELFLFALIHWKLYKSDWHWIRIVVLTQEYWPTIKCWAWYWMLKTGFFICFTNLVHWPLSRYLVQQWLLDWYYE